MRKLQNIMMGMSAAGMLLAGNCWAQDSPAAPAAKSAPAAKAQSGGAAQSGAKPATPAKPRTGTAARPQTPLTLKTQKDKASYAIGINIGKSMRRDEVDIDAAILARGLRDAMAGGKLLLTEDEAKAVLSALAAEMKQKQEVKMAALGMANKKSGEEFLAANKAKDGVVTLPDGLQYKILKEGTGPKPKADDEVVCNYKGTLIDNTEFDSSYKRGEPATFPVNGVIKGWTEALQLMPVGSKWQLFLPSNLAYGERSPGPEIGPDSTLVFEVELMAINPKKADTPKPEAVKPADGKPADAKPEDPAPKPQ
ncbi:MAG TPA: FKBP-type peptidyl-prolyl cis-trans isomerase [Candidatus Saccharimonadales bacterium]|nr:FKBP-type peptidyl-prolyl cis-trans isomerase [Candidatus Saccharimonadales bacterium]